MAWRDDETGDDDDEYETLFLFVGLFAFGSVRLLRVLTPLVS